jgi:hypothetical protein
MLSICHLHYYVARKLDEIDHQARNDLIKPRFPAAALTLILL